MTFENSYALVVGITQYENVTPLPRVSDANEIKKVLIDPELCGYLRNAVRCLDETDATLNAFRDSLDWLERETNTDSSIFLYFSGHGGQLIDGEFKGEYLLTVDTSFADSCDLANTSMSGNEFEEKLNAIQARRILVVFDCCHAGGIGSPKSNSNILMKNGVSDEWYTRLSEGTGRIIMASCRADEFSYILDGQSMSVFTKHFIAGLKGKARNSDGFVKVFDLFDYVQPKVTFDQPLQHPIFRGVTDFNFPIAMHNGAEHDPDQPDEHGFRYDAYISYVDEDPDSTWVWDQLVPRLKEMNLKIAVSGDVESAGVSRISATEQAIRQAKRTIIVLSDRYVADYFSEFQNTIAQQMGLEEGNYRLLPVKISRVSELPTRLSQLVTLEMNLSSSSRIQREWERLFQALKGPLPTRKRMR